MTRRSIARVSCALLLAGLSLTATAPPAPAVSSLKVDVGYGGFILPGRSFPVRVEARTDRLVRGRIEVVGRVDNGPNDSVSVRLPVEIPGGGAKSFVVVVPPIPTFPGGTVGVEARLVEGGGAPIAESARAQARPANDRELVGVMPAAWLSASGGASGPATAPLAVDAGVAQFFEVGPILVDLAPASLEPLGTLVAGAGELGRLTPPAQRRVLAWLDRGGTLLVDADVGTRVEGLPDAWQPGAGGASWAGLGRVRVVPGVAGGNWAGAILPTPSRGASDPRLGFFPGPTSVGNSLADDAGLRVPRISWLLGFLLAYTALVGPVLGFVLNRRKRAELAWVVVPLAAVLFAGGSYTAATGLRGGTRLAHGSVIELSPAGASATSFVGVAARKRQTTDVSLGDESWQAGRAVSGFGGGGQRSEVEITGAGPATRLRLTAGQFAVASVRSPVANPGDIRLTATSAEDGVVEGTIRNDLGTAIDEVLVLVGRHGMNVGRLAPGEERQWRTDTRNVDNQHFPVPEMSLWRDATGQFGPPRPDSPVNFAVWQSSPAGGVARPAGLATAVGWTRDARLPIRIDGRPRSAKGTTAVTTSVAVTPRGRITDMTVRGEMVRGGNEAFGGGDFVALGRVARFVLPEGRPVTRDLVASISAFAAEVEVWDGRRWVQSAPGPPAAGQAPGAFPEQQPGAHGLPLSRPPTGPPAGPQTIPMPAAPRADFGPMGPGGPEGPLVDVPIPASAVVAGSVFIRFSQNGPVSQASLRLRETP